MSQKAQQTIEYSVILGLVAAGIILMGPHVLRSWNASVKGKEDAVIDSLTDPLVEDPDPRIDLPSCDCGVWEEQGCGLAPCKETEMQSSRECSPPGCENEHPEYKYGECLVNDSCCTKPDFIRDPKYCSLNVCTNIADKFENLEPSLREIWIPTLENFCETHIRSEDGEHGCPDKYILYYSVCGDEPAPNFTCEENLEICDFQCDPVDPFTSTPCKDTEDDPLDEEGLTSSLDRTFVYACTEGKKCEALCCPGFCVGEPPGGSDSCADGTSLGECSMSKPFYCTEEGKLVEDCNAGCECEEGLTCIPPGKKYAGQCGCSDGTLDLTCSSEKPKFCWEGELIDACTQCGCPSPLTCNVSTQKCE